MKDEQAETTREDRDSLGRRVVLEKVCPLLVALVALVAPAAAQDLQVGAVQVISSGPSGFEDGQGVTLGAAQRFGRLSVSGEALVTNRSKWWRADERSSSLTWNGSVTLGYQIGPVDLLGGYCWAGWSSGGDLDERKSDSAPCAGAQVGGGWGVVRATVAEYESYGAERDERYDVLQWRLQFAARVTDRVSILTLLHGGESDWSAVGVGLGWRW